MKEKACTDAPRRVVNRSNSILMALHVLVVLASLWAHPPIETRALRTLP